MKDLKKEDLIFPTLLRQIGTDAYRLPYPKELEQPIQNHITSSFGLTKRELFAAMAMQSLIRNNELDSGDLVKLSINYADALINELNKE